MKSSFYHAQQYLAHFSGLGGGRAGPYVPGQAQADIDIQEQLSVSSDCVPRPNGCTSSLPPKLPVYQFIAFSCISQKPYLILSPPNTRSTENHRPPTCHQVSQCPVPCVVPHCKSIICCQICGAHLQSHVIAGYRATGLQSHELLCSKATPGDPLSVHWLWSLHSAG